MSQEIEIEDNQAAQNDEELTELDDAQTKGGSELIARETDQEEDTSTLAIDSDVVEKIVAITCRSVDGILQMKGNLISSIQEGFGGTDITKGVQVEMVGDDACIINVSIIMEYGKSARKIFNELHDRITEKITDMTGLVVKAVNVRVVDVMTREEVEGNRKTSREREQKPRTKSRERTKNAVEEVEEREDQQADSVQDSDPADPDQEKVPAAQPDDVSKEA